MKLKDWCEKEGRTLKWVADQIGMPKMAFYRALQGYRPLKDDYIDKIIELTDGECTYEELKRRSKKE